jgi:hypothetical protein
MRCWARSSFPASSIAVGLFLVVLVNLGIKIFVLVLVIKHFVVGYIGRNLRAITQKDDTAAEATVWPKTLVKIHIDIIRAIVNTVMYSRTTELSCTYLLEADLFAL